MCFPNVEEAAVPGPNEWEKCQVRLRVGLVLFQNWNPRATGDLENIAELVCSVGGLLPPREKR